LHLISVGMQRHCTPVFRPDCITYLDQPDIANIIRLQKRVFLLPNREKINQITCTALVIASFITPINQFILVSSLVCPTFPQGSPRSKPSILQPCWRG
jgi:predicted ABC-type exoprotein transport system permease subunit